MQSEAPVLSGGAAAVAKAWPALAAERDGLAPYDAALAGLDVALVRDVVASLARGGGPPPAPGLLRTVVLARRAAPAVSGVTSDRRPSVALSREVPWTAPAPAAVAPRGAVGPMVVAGAAGIAAALMASRPWAGISVAGQTRTWPGTDVDGGELVQATLLLTIAVLAIGAFYVRRRRSAAHLRGVFALLLVASGGAILGCIRGFGDISEGRDALREGMRAGFGGPLPAGMEGLVSVSAQWGLWSALMLSVIAAAAALYGLVTVRGG